MSDRADTYNEAIELAKAWAEGRRSYCNLGPHPPYTPEVIAVMDAQEVVKWSSLALALRAVGCGKERCTKTAGHTGPHTYPWPPPVEGREGLVMVYSHEHRYLGCMGVETWASLLTDGRADA